LHSPALNKPITPLINHFHTDKSCGFHSLYSVCHFSLASHLGLGGDPFRVNFWNVCSPVGQGLSNPESIGHFTNIEVPWSPPHAAWGNKKCPARSHRHSHSAVAHCIQARMLDVSGQIVPDRTFLKGTFSHIPRS